MNNRALLFFPILISCAVEYKVNPIGTPELGVSDSEEACEPVSLPGEEDKLPIAMCSSSVEQTSPIHGRVDFLGHNSYDPNGFSIVSYDWTIIEKPEGSSAVLGSGIADRNGFQPDLAGAYTMELVVENDRCMRSEPCTVTINAVPSENLWIEVHWEHAGDDMDLHLIQNNGSYESDSDCYYGNCIPDAMGSILSWGDTGALDDPRLDLDDIEGTGPENINIEEPSQGLYSVVVHDFPSSVYEDDNAVTVRIHLDGEMVFEKTKVIAGEDQYVPFAMIEWPSKIIQEME
jgi:hypothetical protein